MIHYLMIGSIAIALQGCNDEQQTQQARSESKAVSDKMLNGVGSTGSGPYIRGGESKAVINRMLDTESSGANTKSKQ